MPASSSPPSRSVHPDGSLALLAYGDLGIAAWRAARDAAGLSRCSHSRPIRKPAPAPPTGTPDGARTESNEGTPSDPNPAI